jgi:uncharacterized Zn-binding protein involved in type VI secretion
MPGVSRVGIDIAGGIIIGNKAPTVFVNGKPITVLGALVSGHDDSPHDAPLMVSASGTVFANGIKVCRKGDIASCGHTASGSGDVFAG